MNDTKSSSEADILDRLVRPGDGALMPEAAQALLGLKFDSEATKRIERLLRSNGAGTISAEDRLQLDRYLRVGQLIDLIQAKARLSRAAPKS